MATGGLARLIEESGANRVRMRTARVAAQQFAAALIDGLNAIAGHEWKLSSITVESKTPAAIQTNAGDQPFVLRASREAQLPGMLDRAMARAICDGSLSLRRDPASASENNTTELTPTEQRLAYTILGDLLSAIAPRTLAPLIHGEANWSFAADDPSKQSGEPAQSGHSVIAIDLCCARDDSIGKLSIAVPATEEHGSSDLSAWQTQRRIDHAALVPGVLRDSEFTLRAVLGAAALPLARIDDLSLGSIIPLGKLKHKVPRVEMLLMDQTICTGTVVADRGWYHFTVQADEETVNG